MLFIGRYIREIGIKLVPRSRTSSICKIARQVDVASAQKACRQRAEGLYGPCRRLARGARKGVVESAQKACPKRPKGLCEPGNGLAGIALIR